MGNQVDCKHKTGVEVGEEGGFELSFLTKKQGKLRVELTT
jgi:hypothetical protein